jgi:membrane-associated HD superfamily phosphohydrolase
MKVVDFISHGVCCIFVIMQKYDLCIKPKKIKAMKKSLFTLVIALATVGFFSCSEPENPIQNPPVAPAELLAGSITDVSAILTWSGNAATWEVVVGEAAPQTVTTTSYTAEGLTPESK